MPSNGCKVRGNLKLFGNVIDIINSEKRPESIGKSLAMVVL